MAFDSSVGFTRSSGFGRVTPAIDTDPLNASNAVAKLVKAAGAETWGGATLDAGLNVANTVAPIGFATSKVITLRVYSPAAGVPILLKAEVAGTPSTYMEKQVSTTKANAWETLTFNFTTPSGGSYNASATYNRLSVFPNFGTSPSAEEVYYFDEIKMPMAPLVYASDYTGSIGSATTAEGGSTGLYVDTSQGVSVDWWWGDVASLPDEPNFYWGYGIDSAATHPTYFGGYVKAPGNGTAQVAGYSSLKVTVGGNKELTDTHPHFAVILKGPAVNSCSASLLGDIAVTGTGVQTYTLPLSGFTLDTACGFASASAALSAGVSEIHVQVLGSNIQYVTNGGGTRYANGLNIGKMSFQ